MQCHLVYAVPALAGFGRVARRLGTVSQNLGLTGRLVSNRRPTQTDLARWPARSPYENTKHLYLALSETAPTLLYHLTEHVRCNFAPDDVFIGHPVFPYREGACGVTELAFRETARPAKLALITPLHSDTAIQTEHINRAYLDHVDRLIPAVDVIFGIMGEYWWDQWPSSPYAHWLPKMVRLDMGLDVRRFPRVKQGFNKPGHRGYLYIGRSDLRKGPELLSRLAQALPRYRWGWIGNGPEIAGVRRISTARPLTPQFMAQVARDYDFFISPSRADPNPTTILESMAWGFPVACTPQSGYYGAPYRLGIYWDEIQKSVAALEHLQYAHEAELMDMADQARAVVEREYTWERFTTAAVCHLGLE